MKYHKLANLIPNMSEESYQVLKTDIQENGLLVPITLYEGKILDGRNRYKACQELGIEPKYEEYKSNSPISYVISLNIKRRHLNSSQIACILLDAKPEIKEEAKKRMLAGKKIDPVPLVGQGNKGKTNEILGKMGGIGAETIRLVEKVKKESPKMFEEIKSGKRKLSSLINKKKAHVSYNGGENEWYTPPKFIESARKTMGSIDVDPASSNIANKIIKATIYYTKKTNGLDKEWDGNVWMNPPYAQPLINEFSQALEKNLRKKIKQAIVLVNNATETKWFQRMIKLCSATCFLKGRIKFIDINGKLGNTPLQGQAILYFGENKKSFKKNFSKYGTILWNEEQ